MRDLQLEIEKFFRGSDYNLEEQLIIENELILSELLDPENSYMYSGKRGFFTYKDAQDVTFFVRLTYNPVSVPYFELKTGWIDEKGKPRYEPSIPPTSPKSSAVDWDKRSNTLAKIFRDEILTFFKEQDLCSTMRIIPISKSRNIFARRMVNKFVDSEAFNILFKDLEIIIEKR